MNSSDVFSLCSLFPQCNAEIDSSLLWDEVMIVLSIRLCPKLGQTENALLDLSLIPFCFRGLPKSLNIYCSFMP